MNKKPNLNDVKSIAAEIDTEIRALTILNTPSAREIRRRYSQKLRYAQPGFILNLARVLMNKYKHRWFAYELIQCHRATFQSIGQVINSWWSADSFARTLAGQAWLNGNIVDTVIHTWARSRDRWWRRAALVSTVALNVRSRGGYGDVPRTLTVCRLLVDDHDDMVAKALSWALRELVVHDPQSVRRFLKKYNTTLVPRVKREVTSKLKTGLKNPTQKKHKKYYLPRKHR